MRGRTKFIAVGGVALGCLLLGRVTFAQTVPACSTLPNPVYITGSTAYQTAAGVFAAKLAALTDSTQMTIVYANNSGQGSCDGPPALQLSATGNTQPMLNGTALTWTAGPTNSTDPTSVTRANCTLDGTHAADVGISDIFWESCVSPAAPSPLPTDIKDFQGPVQAMILVVPAGNTTVTALSAAQAQLIWGCGSGGMVSPFLDNTKILQRGPASGTQGIVAKAIQVSASSFFGATTNAAGIVSDLSTDTTFLSDGIGFIAGDLYDTNKTALNAVAFQAFNQNAAYYADSKPGIYDRKNVRDGHYVVWGPEHFYARVDTSGNPTSAAAKQFLASQDGSMYSTAFNYLQLQTLAGVIPQCAMKVKRAADGGPLMPNTVTDTCGCYYEKVRTGATTCQACPNGNECTGGLSCHHGYCE